VQRLYLFMHVPCGQTVVLAFQCTACVEDVAGCADPVSALTLSANLAAITVGTDTTVSVVEQSRRVPLV
jgi:hypothetical protein